MMAQELGLVDGIKNRPMGVRRTSHEAVSAALTLGEPMIKARVHNDRARRTLKIRMDKTLRVGSGPTNWRIVT